MRKYYFLQLVFVFFISTFTFASCQEKEDAVVPEETCDTLATVQKATNGDLQLLLENGEVLLPNNVIPAGSEEFALEGFKVKKGERIIIGYQVTGVANRGGVKSKLAKVNCIVGLKQKATN